jgi:hypothetical protein
MQKCSSALCNRCISTTHRTGYVTAEVAGVTQYWCSSLCFEDWQKQNMVFLVAAHPFRAPTSRLKTPGYITGRDTGDENDYRHRPLKIPITG